MKKFLLYFLMLISASNAHASLIGYADVVLDYFDSGAGSMAGPYGGTFDGLTGSFPIPVTLDVVLGDDPGYPGALGNFLSLPTRSYVTVGFTDETVIDGVGDDIFITEVGASGESADVYISADLLTFIFLGTVFDNVTTALDLASIGFVNPVQAVKIVGNDAFGGSPGFDVLNVRVLPGSIGEPPTPTVPVPGTLALFGLALVSLGWSKRKKV